MRGGALRFWLQVLAGAAALGILLAGCNQGGFGAFQAGVGNTPNKPPLSAFRVLGQPGLQFTALVSDDISTWLVRGTVPLSIVIVNNQTPVRMIATKQSSSSGILSLQLTLGFTVISTSSTNDPYGIATLQNNAERPGFKPPPPMANPDVRLYVRGPATERFSGLFEDSMTAFEISDRASTIFLFQSPDGAVDATVNQIQDLGPFDLELLLNGAIVARASGGPSVTIRQP